MIIDQHTVLDKGFVSLQSVMGDDLAVVNAARSSFLGDTKGAEKDKNLIGYLMRNEHWSPFQMVEFKWRVKLPIMVARQWMRHDWDFNEQSFRYTEAQEDEFYMPEVWRIQSTSNKQGSSGEVLNALDQRYLDERLQTMYYMGVQYYKEALRMGVAREEARLFLPAFGLYTTVIAKTNLRNLMFFLKQRLDSHAQWEIQQYARALYVDFCELLPWTAEAFDRHILKKERAHD